MSNHLTVAEQIAALRYARGLLKTALGTARGPVLDVCRTLVMIVDGAGETEDGHEYLLDLIRLSDLSGGISGG